ncbi:MAG TPA: rod shape-determining protein MreC [Bryobacteraceae bacterium]|nr:rod shape-determining protein MreC [Bryobacteraceae bacterium]
METSRISAFYRSLIVLASMLLAQLIVVGYQLRTQSDVPLVRLGTVLIIEPINRSMAAIVNGIQGAWFGYVDLRNARQENKSLAAKVEELKLANQKLQSAESEAKRLRGFMGLKSQIPAETVVARVVGGSAGESSRLLMIDKGADAGIKPDLPVMVPDGVVGKVLAVFSDSAQVILLSDPFSGAGVLLEQSRMHGVLKGRNEPLLYLDFISNGEQVATGQRVFTSGEDKIYPPGLPVGVVESATRGQKFLDVKVRPSASLQSLEEVMVILNTSFEMPLPEPVRFGPQMPVSSTNAAGSALASTTPVGSSTRPAVPAVPPPPARATGASAPPPSPRPPASSPPPRPEPAPAVAPQIGETQPPGASQEQ